MNKNLGSRGAGNMIDDVMAAFEKFAKKGSDVLITKDGQFVQSKFDDVIIGVEEHKLKGDGKNDQKIEKTAQQITRTVPISTEPKLTDFIEKMMMTMKTPMESNRTQGDGRTTSFEPMKIDLNLNVSGVNNPDVAATLIDALNYNKAGLANAISNAINRVEGNKFGDQKYLDSWPTKFSRVEVATHLGAGVAPWNIKRFKIEKNKNFFILEKGKSQEVIFYHFHDLRFFLNNSLAFLSSYDLSQVVIDKIYKPYIKKIISIEKKYKQDFNVNQSKINSNFLNKLFLYIKLSIKFIIYYKNFKII
jgi:hypothetical protein